MAVVVADIKKRHPELGDFPTPRVQIFLDMAKRRVSTSSWGARADDAIIELASHLLAVACAAEDADGATGPAGPVTSERVGDIAVTYGDSFGMSSGEMGSTPYGRLFVEMRREIISDRCL